MTANSAGSYCIIVTRVILSPPWPSGGAFEFHGSLSMVCAFDNEARFGVTYSHISNAGVYASNPALDSVLPTCAFPIGPVF